MNNDSSRSDTLISAPTENNEILLEVKNLKTYFPVKSGFFSRVKGYVKAVDGVSFSIKRGTTMGLVGESGCGKTTLGRSVLHLTPKTEGSVLFEGRDIYALGKNALRSLRPELQIIFQDPFSSLSPRLTIGEIVGEAVLEHNIVKKDGLYDYVTEVLSDCGISADAYYKYPHEFSGGQRQRICIARSLALNPRFIVCDEPVSALDVSVQAQIINLLTELQKKRSLTYLFISHDLSVIRHISDSVMVMLAGGIAERGTRDEIFDNPVHPYTKLLLESIPINEPSERSKASVRNKESAPAVNAGGCPFYPRCKCRKESCSQTLPPETRISETHFVCCHAFLP